MSKKNNKSEAKTELQMETTLAKDMFTLFPYGYKLNTANKDIVLLDFYEARTVNKKREIHVMGSFALTKEMSIGLAEQILNNLKKVNSGKIK